MRRFVCLILMLGLLMPNLVLAKNTAHVQISIIIPQVLDLQQRESAPTKKILSRETMQFETRELVTKEFQEKNAIRNDKSIRLKTIVAR